MARRKYIKRQKNPLIVICSEGGNNTSEKIYFSNFKDRKLRIQFSSGNSTDPNGMYDDLLKYIDKEDIENEDNCFIYLVLDTDLSSSRIKKIKELEEKCTNKNITIITSSPTFEIWYLMHYKDKGLTFASSKEVKKELNKILDGKYKESFNMYPIIIDKINKALKTSKLISTKSKDDYEANPHTKVHVIIDKIKELKETNS